MKLLPSRLPHRTPPHYSTLMRAFPAILLVFLALAAADPAWIAEAREPISHEKLWRLKQVGAPVPSPNGRWVVVPVAEPSYDEADETDDLWIVPGDGSAPPRRLTTAKGKESSPAWSPDGAHLAFSAKREGDDKNQIYVIDLAGGEARRLTQLALGARAPQWSPDGKQLLFQGPVHRDATNDLSNKAMADERKNAKSKVRVFEDFPVRRWDKWLDDVQTHLFVIASDGSEPRGICWPARGSCKARAIVARWGRARAMIWSPRGHPIQSRLCSPPLPTLIPPRTRKFSTTCMRSNWTAVSRGH
jgi:hypothetical protein